MFIVIYNMQRLLRSLVKNGIMAIKSSPNDLSNVPVRLSKIVKIVKYDGLPGEHLTFDYAISLIRVLMPGVFNFEKAFGEGGQ